MRRDHGIWSANKIDHCGRSASTCSGFLCAWPGDARFCFGSSAGKVLKSVPVVLTFVAIRIFIVHFRAEEANVSGGTSQTFRNGIQARTRRNSSLRNSRVEVPSDRTLRLFSSPFQDLEFGISVPQVVGMGSSGGITASVQAFISLQFGAATKLFRNTTGPRVLSDLRSGRDRCWVLPPSPTLNSMSDYSHLPALPPGRTFPRTSSNWANAFVRTEIAPVASTRSRQYVR